MEQRRAAWQGEEGDPAERIEGGDGRVSGAIGARGHPPEAVADAGGGKGFVGDSAAAEMIGAAANPHVVPRLYGCAEGVDQPD
jgi:hypothetical protein